ncbi:MAG: hypothetical protein WCF36_03405 [Candidatus Nanopelagicales bacterium]
MAPTTPGDRGERLRTASAALHPRQPRCDHGAYERGYDLGADATLDDRHRARRGTYRALSRIEDSAHLVTVLAIRGLRSDIYPT